ncbi:MAG TPA: DUF5693 family protein, partial [Fimbriimonadaceae bacterium]|nr:DUF5693 family protein [Fimbriimonadaceae bacterium]
CILLCAGLSSYSLWQRHQAEGMNKAVGLVAEIETVEALGASQGLALPEALARMKAAGLNGIVLSERTVSELIAEGQLEVLEGRVIKGSPAAMERALKGLLIRFPGRPPANTSASPQMAAAVMEVPISLVRGTSIGLNPEQARAVRESGMFIVGRMSNPTGVSSTTVQATLEWARQLGAIVFLPQGEQVLGRRDAINHMADTLRALGMVYASPEFVKIGGDANVVQRIPDLTVRLHSAQTQELDKLPLSEAIDRYVRAARERNQRVLLLRPVSFAAEQPLESFGSFVGKVKARLETEGMEIKAPHGFAQPDAPRWVFLVLALAAVPVIVWTAFALTNDRRWAVAAALVSLLLAGACFGDLGRPYMALLAATMFPIAAFVMLDRRDGRNWAVEFILVALVCLVGGMVLAGLLNGLPYFIRAEQFPGVKLAHFGPIGVIGLYFFWRLSQARESLKSPILWSQAVIGLIILVAFVLMATRTGNDNPAAVSGVELKFRSLMDNLLFVRPRTKEFLIGHPLLILGIGMLIRYRQQRRPWSEMGGWIALLLMAGSIGVTSIVNTMAHLHTSLPISFARIGVGLVLGGILGAVLLTATRRFEAREGV